MKKNFLIFLGIFISLAASRFIPHPPNFTSLLALSFYVPVIFGIRFIPYLIISFIITDFIIGYHNTTHWTWGSVLLIGLSSQLFLKNIFTEKRNTLGPIYIALIYLFYPKLLDSNSKFFLFLFLSMVIMFPLMSSLTHIDANLDQIVEKPELLYESFLRFGTISGAFESLHYDAFSNVLATLEYVEINGISFGYQLLGVILFFIPRSIWVSKPTSTGELIGEYLMNTTPRDYSNLSNAIVSEGYINLGVFGVVLLAIILAYFIVKFISWMISKNYFKEFIAFYFALHLLFLLRGDLTNGVSYFVGPLLSIYFVPKFLIRLFR